MTPENKKRKIGRPKGSTLPRDYWSAMFPGVDRTNLSFFAACVKLKTNKLAKQLSEASSWVQCDIQRGTFYAYEVSADPRITPLSSSKTKDIICKWLTPSSVRENMPYLHLVENGGMPDESFPTTIEQAKGSLQKRVSQRQKQAEIVNAFTLSQSTKKQFDDLQLELQRFKGESAAMLLNGGTEAEKALLSLRRFVELPEYRTADIAVRFIEFVQEKIDRLSVNDGDLLPLKPSIFTTTKGLGPRAQGLEIDVSEAVRVLVPGPSSPGIKREHDNQRKRDEQTVRRLVNGWNSTRK